MMNKNNTIYSSGNLTVDTSLGRVTCTRGKTLRLSPVNMKVLQALVNRPGEVISRAELFEGIWKNQVVSDDTLTRCISDLRSHLSKTFGHTTCIETLPKRGYRWTLGDTTEKLSEANEDKRHGRSAHGWRRAVTMVAVYAVSLVLLATAAAWIVGKAAQPRMIRLAVFPTESSSPDSAELAREVSDALAARLLLVDSLQVLAKSAVNSRPQNPFPYFFYEFDARWVVESHISRSDGGHRVTVSLVDARTAVVGFMQTAELDDLSNSSVAAANAAIVDDMEVFLNTEPGL